MCVARDELEQMLAHKEVKAATRLPVLLFANKQDMPAALEAADVCALLNLQVSAILHARVSMLKPISYEVPARGDAVLGI